MMEEAPIEDRLVDLKHLVERAGRQRGEEVRLCHPIQAQPPGLERARALVRATTAVRRVRALVRATTAISRAVPIAPMRSTTRWETPRSIRPRRSAGGLPRPRS